MYLISCAYGSLNTKAVSLNQGWRLNLQVSVSCFHTDFVLKVLAESNDSDVHHYDAAFKILLYYLLVSVFRLTWCLLFIKCKVRPLSMTFSENSCPADGLHLHCPTLQVVKVVDHRLCLCCRFCLKRFTNLQWARLKVKGLSLPAPVQDSAVGFRPRGERLTVEAAEWHWGQGVSQQWLGQSCSWETTDGTGQC